MARFYDGQQVVCIKPLEFWLSNVSATAPRLLVPRMGLRYVVGRYDTIFRDYMTLDGFNSDHWYREDGFAPITDSQVRGIIEEAHRVPSAREYEKL